MQMNIAPAIHKAIQDGKKVQDIGLALPVLLTVHVYPAGQKRANVRPFDLEETLDEMQIRSNNYRCERMYNSPVPPKIGDATRFNQIPQENQMRWENFFADLRKAGHEPISNLFEIQTLWFSADDQRYEVTMEIEAHDLSHARNIRDQLTGLYGFNVKRG